MGVDTSGQEAIRNAAEVVSGDVPGATFLKTLNGWLFQKIGRKVEVSSVNSTTVDYMHYIHELPNR